MARALLNKTYAVFTILVIVVLVVSARSAGGSLYGL